LSTVTQFRNRKVESGKPGKEGDKKRRVWVSTKLKKPFGTTATKSSSTKETNRVFKFLRGWFAV
jgi:hypothetical protein